MVLLAQDPAPGRSVPAVSGLYVCHRDGKLTMQIRSDRGLPFWHYSQTAEKCRPELLVAFREKKVSLAVGGAGSY